MIISEKLLIKQTQNGQNENGSEFNWKKDHNWGQVTGFLVLDNLQNWHISCEKLQIKYFLLKTETGHELNQQNLNENILLRPSADLSLQVVRGDRRLQTPAVTVAASSYTS